MDPAGKNTNLEASTVTVARDSASGRGTLGVGPSLDVEEATVRRGRRTLGPFTFHVNPGEVVLLVGPNGSGKTTAVRLALGLERARSGTVRMNDRQVSPTSPPLGCGYVPDHSEFWEWCDGWTNLAAFAGDDQKTSSLLRDFGIADAATRPVDQWSRGMRQRLAIARALGGDPAVLVMDEPTIALDVDGAELVAELCRARAARGVATLVATHDQQLIAEVDARLVPVVDAKCGT